MTRSEAPTVAVVDDDESVREALGNLLASLGLGVATFASAEEFLASPACRAAACLITDVQMPGMSGLELQRRIVADGNGLPVILITAFPAGPCPPAGRGRGRLGTFAKPFEGRLMIHCIERALAETGASHGSNRNAPAAAAVHRARRRHRRSAWPKTAGIRRDPDRVSLAYTSGQPVAQPRRVLQAGVKRSWRFYGASGRGSSTIG